MAKRPKKPSVPEKGSPNDSYKVGPRKPPRHSQFKPGQSGNPGGKKKGSQNFSTILREELEREVSVNGGAECMTILRAIIRGRTHKGASGDARASENMMYWAREVERRDEPPETERDDPEDDSDFLDRAMERYRRIARDRDGKGSGAASEGPDEPDDD